jgi:hypothetical protein
MRGSIGRGCARRPARYPAMSLKQEVRGRCASIWSIRQTPLCVRSHPGRRRREVSNRQVRKAGGVGAVEVAQRSVQSENIKLIPEKMVTPGID